MAELRERFIETNGIKLHVMEAGPADGPMIMFLHGFPEFWFAWRKQIGYFADKGYLVVVPDQRGYNLSDKPEGIAAYKTDELAKDVIGLIDFYGRDQIYLVGHDWGASVSWWTALNIRADQTHGNNECASSQGNEPQHVDQSQTDAEKLSISSSFSSQCPGKVGLSQQL